jgi:CopA family copper-resistance protein
VKGVLAGSIAMGVGSISIAQGQEPNSIAKSNILAGTEFDLTVSETKVNFTGKTRTATAINGSVPAPTLVWHEGETVTIRVTNNMSVSTSIHWHGIILPFQMDGVPGISYDGIAPGETFTYQFTVQQAGTYWYHSHTGFQEMTGMYGSIVIKPKLGEKITTDQDMVVLLSDWTDENPMSVYSHLKQQSDYYNYNQPTARDFLNDVSKYGIGQAFAMRTMWNKMRMSPTDLSDSSATAFTFLMNGYTPNRNWTGVFNPGESIRLRFINGASNTFFDVRIPGLKLTVVASDGQDIEPVSADEFRFGPGETYDVIVKPTADAHSIFAQSMDRSGYTRGTLTVKQGLTAAVPTVDQPVWLAMTDMMGDMSGMSGMSDMPSMKMDDIEQMDKVSMNHGGMSMDHSKHDMQKNPLAVPSKTVNHASSEYGPSVDARVDMPRTNLDDPGVGLRDNGRRVLTLADLHTLGGPLDSRAPTREIELHLTGNMERYSWSFDGLEFGKSTPVHFNHGERVRVILQNDTMMTHPMHLHGVWSELENDKGEILARRHTIPVQPAQRISFVVNADALGRWAWHCHLLFHMDAGMFREVEIS